MRPATFLLAAVLAAGFARPAGAADKVEPTWSYDSFRVELRLLPRREVAEQCARLGAWGGNVELARKAAKGRPVGCAVTFHDERRCVVYAPAPSEVDDDAVTVLGHEVLHCARGEYHSAELPH